MKKLKEFWEWLIEDLSQVNWDFLFAIAVTYAALMYAVMKRNM